MPLMSLFTYNSITNEYAAAILLRLKNLKLNEIEKMLFITIALFNCSSDDLVNQKEGYVMCGYVCENLISILHDHLPAQWNEVNLLIGELHQIGHRFYQHCMPLAVACNVF